MSEPAGPLEELFARFAAAVAQGDEQAFRSLAVRDAPAQVELFRENSKKVRAGGGSVVLRQIRQEGLLAELTFEVRDASGRAIDSAKLTASQEPDGWRIRTL